MHTDVKAKSRGKCPKCKMTLVRKRSSKTNGDHVTSGAH
ncbi:MAG: heavy metal-binding domain-containing protein [Pyrinomonadaceae bacterium]